MEFRILGPLQVVADGVALELGGPKQRAVLATLVLRANEVVSTDALVGTLWRDDPPRSAVGIVRTYVSRLRRLLDNADTGDETVLVSRPPGYGLDVAPDRIDAHRFERLARQAGRALEAGQYDVASATLSEALGLWRGDVLADLAGLDALRPTASRLEQLRLAATEDRFEAELALGHHAELVGELEALVELHPFRERLWGQLVVALYRSERQADALAAYQILRSTLVDQVGVEPGPDLQALEHDVLRQAEELRWRPPDQGQRRSGRQPTEPVPEGRLARSDTSRQIPLPPGLARGPHDQPFVGRTRERAVLERSLDAARSGTFNAVFVTGPPGIGKTALAGWLARVAHAAGATVVMGRADEGAGVPFQPFDEAIRHWTLHTEPEDLRRLDDGAAAELSRLAPVLAERRDREEPTRGRTPQAAGGDADRQRLLVAIGGWVEALAARGPAVIVLDDLHWADPAAVVAVRHLVRHPPAAAVLLVVNCRTPARENPELADGLTATAAGGHVVRLELAGLSDGEVLDLLPLAAGAAGAAGEVRPEASRSFAAALARRTGGNPLFVHEMLRHLTERGVLGGGETGNLEAFEAFEAFGVPSGVTEVIEQRLRRLPAPTADVLRPGALLGQHIDLAVLSRLVDTSPLAVVEALEPALAVGLVEQDGPRPDRFAFSHALVREAILEGLGPSARIRLHWRAGEAIASLTSSGSTAGGGGARLGEIATTSRPALGPAMRSGRSPRTSRPESTPWRAWPSRTPRSGSPPPPSCSRPHRPPTPTSLTTPGWVSVTPPAPWPTSSGSGTVTCEPPPSHVPRAGRGAWPAPPSASRPTVRSPATAPTTGPSPEISWTRPSAASPSCPASSAACCSRSRPSTL